MEDAGSARTDSGFDDSSRSELFNLDAEDEERRSPDLFCDDDDDDDDREEAVRRDEETNPCEVLKRINAYYDKLHRKLEKALQGVPPPPSVTISQITAAEMIDSYRANLAKFNASSITPDSSFVRRRNDRWSGSERFKDLAEGGRWPDMTLSRFYGVQYNCAPASEGVDGLLSRYLPRFVGCETASSCCAAVSSCTSPLKRSLRPKVGGGGGAARSSPGKRLSHLARRKMALAASRFGEARRQILVDRRKLLNLSSDRLRRRTPLKKPTPSKKTPKKSASAKKQTPKKTPKTPLRRSARKSADKTRPNGALFSPEGAATGGNLAAATRTKRALFFSPIKEGDESTGGDVAKRPRLDLVASEPPSQRAKLQKSHSFGGDRSRRSFQDGGLRQPLTRHASESLASKPGELSAHHKKKLLWAVSLALKERGVGVAHDDFRKHFSSLARLTQKLIQLPYNARLLGAPGNCTSDTFLKIARQHTYAIIKNTSLEEIFKEERVRQMTLHNATRVTGYVPFLRTVDEAVSNRTIIGNSENSSSSFSSDSKDIVNQPVVQNKRDHVLQDITSRVESRSSNKKCENIADPHPKFGQKYPCRRIDFDTGHELLRN